MTTWTDTARQQLDRYFEQVRDTLRASGADPDEVSEDLRRHIHEEVAARQLEVVTEEDVRQILGRIGAPEAPAGPGLQSPAASAASPGQLVPGRRSSLLLFFSVILPCVTLAIELFSHMCAGVFFDPIPSVWHVLMVAAVPAANGWAWWAARKGPARAPGMLGLANGFATGISAFYTLAYLPILPFALIGILYLGWGLLPMAPLFALVGALMLRSHLRRRRGPPEQVPAWWPGLGLAALALALTVLPSTLTRYWSGRAATGTAAQRTSALQWLRWLGQRKTLLADCYGTTTWMRQSPIDLHLFGVPVNPAPARDVFFRVTGQPFNSLPPPQLNFTRGGWNWLDDLTWDREQGGDTVGSRVKGLSLTASRLDGLIESDAAVGYVEWVMEFRNTSAQAREARAQVALPPGGVVTRLTLWVNGEEREAAFAGRAEVRQAYQEVAIRRRRDPVLVTSCGPDRVLVQCFPVPADGGTMKIRMGITAPLIMESLATGVLPWPHFLERNFSLEDGFGHSLWVESKAVLDCRSPELKAETSPSASHALRGTLADRLLDEPQSALRVRRSPGVTQVRVPETLHGGVIQQSLAEHPAPRPGRAVLVVDGSRSMQDHFPAIAAALQQLPDGLEVSGLIAADEVRSLLDQPQPLNPSLRQVLADKVRNLTGAGGQDNVPALVRALDMASHATNGVVLWIHGPQPVLLDQAAHLSQVFLWRGDHTRLHDFQIGPGPNRIAEQLDGFKAVQTVPRLGSVTEDLEQLFGAWGGQRPRVAWVRQHVAKDAPQPPGPEASRHLARLWAFEEVTRLAASRQRDAALMLASHYQLVTPVSGAVVLETREQFERAGLQPAAADTVPSVPEPATLWWLAAAVLLAAGWWRRRRTRTTCTHSLKPEI